MNRTFLHAGDIGDIIASLPAVRALGGGRYVITDAANGRRQSLRGPRFDAVRPLLESQPYISAAEWSDHPQDVTHDFTTFREGPPLDGECLARWQARHLGVPITTDPWLNVQPAAAHAGRTIVARSPRYHAPSFPWRYLLDHHRGALFVGLRTEHVAFQAEFGRIDFLPTADLLELARVIAGARLFIGNQSSPMWIALGLGVPIIQETCPTCPNTIIPRDNCRYTLELADLNALWSEFQSQAYA